MRDTTRQTFIVFITLLAGLVILRWTLGRPAPTPEAFKDTLTLDQALLRSVETGKPVLVLATADWCPPCQHLKRGALRDERVVQTIREKTVPVYLDVTRSADDEVVRTARSINLDGIPALIVLKGGSEIGRIEGDLPAIKLLSWLEQF